MRLQAARALLADLADVLAPPRCMGCVAEGTWLCHLCRLRTSTFSLSCIICRKPHPRGLTCATCQSETLLTGVVTTMAYHHPVAKRGIGWLKYKGVRSVAPILSSLLIPRLLAIAPFSHLSTTAVLVPIPLHKTRLRTRGFNQSEDLARAISATTDIPVRHLLKRTRATWTQSHLPLELRQQNTQLAFQCAETLPTERKIILLIDDVTTTGSTLTAAASALSSLSPTAIWGCTIARG